MYESIRQLGDASWRILGYEPLNHEITLDGLKNYNIKYNLKLNLLPRFKKIRNDINYNGFQASVNQAEEIIDFWNKCCKEIINILNSKITSNK
jgi:hypothetical protein